MSWNNNDGLYVKFHKELATKGSAGAVPVADDTLHVVEAVITLTDLGTTEAIVDNHTVIPSGSFIEEVVVVADVAATSGGSPTLDVGLIRQDRTTAYDDDGLVAALAMTSYDAIGERTTLTKGVSGAGALVGTVLANSGVITASRNTATYTAGVVRVRIKYRKIS